MLWRCEPRWPLFMRWRHHAYTRLCRAGQAIIFHAISSSDRGIQIDAHRYPGASLHSLKYGAVAVQNLAPPAHIARASSTCLPRAALLPPCFTLPYPPHPLYAHGLCRYHQ